ncbi:cysteine protease ATG4B, partial [Reticulomyxa filosa]
KEESKQHANEDKDKKRVWKKSLLLFIPLRLGLEKLNLEYMSGILHCLEMKHSIGIIGGKPQRSLYFVGYQRDHLFYLDPHYVFEYPSSLSSSSSSFSGTSDIPFTCKTIQSLHISQLDPCMALGFFIRDQLDFDLFWNQCLLFSTLHSFPIFQVGEQMPTLPDLFPTLAHNTLSYPEDPSPHSQLHPTFEDSEWEIL